MTKWNFLDKLKIKKKEIIPKEETKKENEDNADIESIIDYKETLYSKDSDEYEEKNEPINQPSPNLWSEQRRYRDVDSIENNIDHLPKYRIKGVTANTEMDKKVDKILSKNGTIRKPANVIYVVSKPQPGQVRGDWAVRSHRKIFSHHRKKENAIKVARDIARDRKATVLVQNTDGTFSDGFKPRTKK